MSSLGWWSWIFIRKQAEQVVDNKPVRSTPAQPLRQILTLGTELKVPLVMGYNVEQPSPLQVAFGHAVSSPQQ